MSEWWKRVKRHDMWDVALVYAFLLACLVLLFGVGTGLYYVGSRYACHRTAGIMELDGRYDFYSGCFILIDGQWVPRGQLRDELEPR